MQRLAVSLALDFRRVLQRVLHAAEALNQLHRSFIADARRAGDIVDGIAAQRHNIHNLVRRNAENLLDFGSIADQVVLGRIEHADAVADQLHHVLVAGNHKDRIARVDGFARQRADHVICLEAGCFEHRNAIGLKRSPDVGHLLG